LGTFIYDEYTKKEYAVQQKVGGRRIGAVNSLSWGMNSPISMAIYLLKKTN
jgi:hypothetical protein